MAQTYIIREDFDQLHSCITISEYQWLLRHAKRHTSWYTFLLLAGTCGLRCDELLRLTLHNIIDWRAIHYRVDKARRETDCDRVVIRRKHRTVLLDPWVGDELREYCRLHCATLPTGELWSAYHDKVPNKDGERLTNKLFPWRGVDVIDAMMAKTRKAMAAAGFDALRVDRQSSGPERVHRLYVVRVHMLRHLALSIFYAKHGGELKRAQEWIRHSKSQTTDAYVHSPHALGVSLEFLQASSYATLCGFDDRVLPLSAAVPPAQRLLNMF